MHRNSPLLCGSRETILCCLGAILPKFGRLPLLPVASTLLGGRYVQISVHIILYRSLRFTVGPASLCHSHLFFAV